MSSSRRGDGVTAGAHLVKVDGQRWKVVIGINEHGREATLSMPRCLWHPLLGSEERFTVPMASRKVAREALDAYERGESPPCYRFTADGSLGACAGHDDGMPA